MLQDKKFSWFRYAIQLQAEGFRTSTLFTTPFLQRAAVFLLHHFYHLQLFFYYTISTACSCLHVLPLGGTYSASGSKQTTQCSYGIWQGRHDGHVDFVACLM